MLKSFGYSFHFNVAIALSRPVREHVLDADLIFDSDVLSHQDRRWLNNILTENGSLSALQDIDYTFDRTGNILSIVNISGRYTTNQNYE